MRVHVLRREQTFAAPPEQIFPFFADAANLESITPPLLRFRVLTPGPIEMRAGAMIRYRLRVRRMPISWLTTIEEWEPPRRFVDRQVRGPYALWHHTHEFEPVDTPSGPGTLMRDTVRWSVGWGVLGALATLLFVRRDVEAIFDHRAQTVERELRRGGFLK